VIAWAMTNCSCCADISSGTGGPGKHVFWKIYPYLFIYLFIALYMDVLNESLRKNILCHGSLCALSTTLSALECEPQQFLCMQISLHHDLVPYVTPQCYGCINHA